ncbi:MAG: hypothetical protein GY772_05530 [bacterium]|nr:hypothetical protein [bacterium]
MYGFWNEERRNLILDLPTESGEKVFVAMAAFIRANTGFSTAFNVVAWENYLQRLVRTRWRIVSRLILMKLDPHRVVEESKRELEDMDLDQIPAWYKGMYDEYAKGQAFQQFLQTDPSTNPGYAWRSGQAERAERVNPQKRAFDLYPRGTVGAQAPASKRSRRAGVEADIRAPGTMYDGPADPGMAERRAALEEPGLLAGTSTSVLPMLVLRDVATGGYKWVPLARRVDLDRLLQLMQQCPEFGAIELLGDRGSTYKVRASR